MVIVGLVLGLAAGLGVGVADTRGIRWVVITSAVAFLALAVAGFAYGLSQVTAAAMVGVVLAYALTKLVSVRRRSRASS